MGVSEVQVKNRRSKVKHNAVFSIGTNDADYVVVTYDKHHKVDFSCPYYTRWKHMLYRCYDPKYQKGKPTYKGCTVCEEWLTFSNFKKWMQEQDWEGKELDKDLIDSENTVYCPEKCLFIPRALNTALSKLKIRDNGLPSGVAYQGYQKGSCKYIVTYYNKGLRTSKRLPTLEDAFNFYSEVRYNQLNQVLSENGLSKYSENLKRRFEVMKNKLKQRGEGMQIHGMFIKQSNLDALQQLGITYDKQACKFTGVLFLAKDLQKADEIFYNLGITYSNSGEYSSGVYIESTGKVGG